MSSRPANPSSMEVAEALRLRVSRLARGSKIPSVRELMKQFRVGQVVVQQAIDALENEGVLQRQLGRGTFVIEGGKAATRTVTILRSDYPSRRGDEITRQTQRLLGERDFESLVITYSDMSMALDLLRSASASDAYIIQPMLPHVPLELLSFLYERSHVVVVDGVVEGTDIDGVASDWFQGLNLAARHLLEAGHRRIALVSGEPVGLWNRLAAHFESLRLWAGLDPQQCPVITSATQAGESSTRGMRERSMQLFEAGDLPFTAAMVVSFASAQGLLDAAEAAGVAIPDQLSVVALDNPDLGKRSHPGLTMVGDSSEAIAQRLIDAVENRLQHPHEPPSQRWHRPELVERNSVRSLR